MEVMSMESDYYYWINYIFVKVIGGYINPHGRLPLVFK